MANDSQNFLVAMVAMPRFAPSWFSAFILGISLLFINDLPINMKKYMIPSLLVYSLGSIFLGTLHRMLSLNYAKNDFINNEQPIPSNWKITILILHTAWFSCFIFYNFHRGAL